MVSPQAGPDLLDHLGVQRLAGRQHLAQRVPGRGQVGLHEHPPHRRGRAERGHPGPLQHRQQLRGVEPGVGVDEHRRAGQPRCEHVAPGVLGPAGGGDVQVHVAGLQPHPVHGRQVPDRVGHVRVLHQLGQRGGAGGEVEQGQVAGLAGPGQVRVGPEELVRPPVVHPAVGGGRVLRAAHGDLAQRQGQVREPVGFGPGRHQQLRLAAVHPVGQIGGRQLRGGRDDHRAEADGAQHQLPQRYAVAEHHQHPVATLQPQLGQQVGRGDRAGRQLGEGQLRLVVTVDHPEGDAVRVLRRQTVEPVGGEVVDRQLGPPEPGGGHLVRGAVLQQEVASGADVAVQRHRRDLRSAGRGPQRPRPHVLDTLLRGSR